MPWHMGCVETSRNANLSQSANREMNVLILDDQLGLSVPVRRLASLRGWQTHFVGSLHELELAVHAHGRTALVLVNLQPPLTAWELGQRLRGLALDGPVVVLSEAGCEDGLGELPGVVWLERPSDEAEVEPRLERA